MKTWLRTLVLLAMLTGMAWPVQAQEKFVTETFQNAAEATGNGTALAVDKYTTIGLQVVISDTATVTFEVTSDGTNWVSAACVSIASTSGTLTTTATASGAYQCNIAGMQQFRARVSAYTGGTVTVTGRATTAVVGKKGGALPSVGNEGDCLLTSTGAWAAGACPGAGTGAPTTATYITQTADGTLSAEQALGSLATGLVSNTTTTGVLSIYAGASCTNQVIRVLSAAGAATCATITSSFVDTTIWTGTVSGGVLKATSQGVLAQAVAGTDYVAPGGALGTPSSGTATNLTGLPVSTGISGLGTGVATFLATPSSANLASALTGETGSGAAVFGTSPTITSPTIATSLLMPNATSNPGTCTIGMIHFDNDATAGQNLYGCTATNTWTLLGDGGGGGSVATDTIWDAAGDLAVGSGSNTASRLAMGTANQLLRVNSGATALEWATVSGTIGGTVGATDNAVPRADGTGGATLQASGCTINDSDQMTCAGGFVAGTSGTGTVTMLEGTAAGAGTNAGEHNLYFDSADSLLKSHENGNSAVTYYSTSNPQTTITGNAGTATALASNPTDCSSNQFANAIAASGNLTCGSITDSDVPNTITIDLASTATALASNPTDCSANQFANAIAANGNLTCGAIADADVPDTITASNYLPLAGGTMTGSLITDNLGIEFAESDTNPTCGANDYHIYADLSENKLKKCMNGSATDLDTTGGTPSFDTITGGTNTTAAMVVGTGGSLAVSGSGTIAATTAAALAANGSNCSAGSAPLGVDAAGAVESCTDFLEAGDNIGAATATTPSANDNDTSVATTAYVQTELTAYASDTVTFTGKTLDAEGTGNTITIPRRIWFPAAGCNNATAGSVWDLPTSNPAVAACVTGTNTQKGVLDFADGANALSAQITYKLPSTWTGTVELNVKWFSATTTNNVVWQTQTSCVADAETDDPSWNTADAFTADAAKGTANQTNDASDTSVTMTGCAAGELLHLKILRDPAHASDTHAGTARLIGAELVIREVL